MNTPLLRPLRFLAMTMLTVALACNLTACGNKGKLKSPAQIQVDEAKKDKKQAKREKEKAGEEQKQSAPPPSSEVAPPLPGAGEPLGRPLSGEPLAVPDTPAGNR